MIIIVIILITKIMTTMTVVTIKKVKIIMRNRFYILVGLISSLIKPHSPQPSPPPINTDTNAK